MGRLLILKGIKVTKAERLMRAARDAEDAATFAENQHKGDWLSRTLDPDYAGKKRAEADTAHAAFKASAQRAGWPGYKREVKRPGSRGGHARTTKTGTTSYKLVNGGHWNHAKRPDGSHDVRAPKAGEFFRHPNGMTALATEDDPTGNPHPIVEHDPTNRSSMTSMLPGTAVPNLAGADLDLGGQPEREDTWSCKRCATENPSSDTLCAHCGARGFPDEMTKGAGEGSRGGEVVGHTRSGKPVYGNHDHPAHAGFTAQDHHDAYQAHSDKAQFASTRMKLAARDKGLGLKPSTPVAGLKRDRAHHLAEMGAHHAAFQAAGGYDAMQKAAGRVVRGLAHARRLIVKALGARGGKVIGTTRSGKPIYDRHDHPAHAGFTPQDHDDAIEAHVEHSLGNPVHAAHYDEMRHHRAARDQFRAEDQRDRAAGAMRGDVEAHNQAAMAKAATAKKQKPLIGKDAFKQKPQVLDGETTLGKTKRGKDVFASGADAAGYDDADHQEAAGQHRKAHLRHKTLADLHRTMSEKDDDWQRSEEHAGESTRHQKLADHHLELARDHLTAGGHGGSATFKMGDDGKPVMGESVPYSDKERQTAKDALAARTHHTHPGGLTDRDRAAYAAGPEDEDAESARVSKRP